MNCAWFRINTGPREKGRGRGREGEVTFTFDLTAYSSSCFLKQYFVNVVADDFGVTVGQIIKAPRNCEKALFNRGFHVI